MVQPQYVDISKHVKSHISAIHLKRWVADNEWEGGNKWFKLKYNLLQAEEKGYRKVVTIGGPWSNHLCALAYAGGIKGIETIGLIRGAWRLNSPTVAMEDMVNNGMQLQGLDTQLYDLRESEDFKVWIRDQYPDAYYIPEGGANYMGLMGAMEMISKEDQDGYDHIWVAGGTGTTAAGILLNAKPNQQIHVVFSLKAPLDSLRELIRNQLRWMLSDADDINEMMGRLTVYGDEIWGGYGKADLRLFEMIANCQKEGLHWDRVYTGKLWWFLLQQDFSEWRNQKILIIHTGGLQGNRSIISS